MVEHLKEIDNIYDLLALCSSSVLIKFDDNPYEFGMFDDNKYKEISSAIETFSIEKEEIGHVEAFKRLKKYLVKYFTKNDNIEACYAVIKFIDEFVAAEILENVVITNGIKKYSRLNSQYYNCVKILPKKRNTYIKQLNVDYRKKTSGKYDLLRNDRECYSSVLDRETSNYMIWDKEHIDKYDFSVYHIEQRSPISKHFDKRKKLVFGIVPGTCKDIDNVLDIQYEGNTFSVTGIKENEIQNLTKKYKDALEMSRNLDVDFMILPELLMSEEIFDILKESVSDSGMPQFIINGSIWSNHRNRTIVANGTEEELFSYYKKEPYSLKKDGREYKEYLDTKVNKEYPILEIENVGRIGVCICKDILNEDVKMFHKLVGTKILIVPAYSESGDLYSAAEGLAKDYNCIVIIANACSAVKEVGHEVGFIAFPAKDGRTMSRTVYKKSYFRDECMSGCDNICKGNFWEVDCSEYGEYDGKLTFGINELRL